MDSQFEFRAAACAAVLLVAACDPSTPVDAKARSLSTGAACESMAGPDAVVTTTIAPTCVNCTVADAERVADGDTGTAAVFTITANATGGIAVRVSQDETFAAGRQAGMILATGRNVSISPSVTIRTYLDGVLQEQGRGSDGPAGSPYTITTTKPFDAVEVAVDAGAITQDGGGLLVEACSGLTQQPGPPSRPEDDGRGYDSAPAAVIADLSTGNNPYHSVYRRPDWKHHPSTVIPGFPADAPALELTFGRDWEADRLLDEPKWRAMQTGVTYWIPGTNLLYLRTRQDDDAYPGIGNESLPYETTNHGVMTAGVIAQACPDCYLLIVSDPEGGYTYPLDFIARNAPWIDVAASTQQQVITALTTPTSLPSTLEGGYVGPLMGPASPYASAAKRWVESGRLYFIAAGNDPITGTGIPPTLDRSVPPWFTIVGGAYAECRGSEADSGRPNEFVSEFVARGPSFTDMNGYETVAGTSFSTPLVATHFAQALKRVRRELGDTREPGTYWAGAPQDSPFLADGKLTRDELYTAFAQAAELFMAEEYTGPCGIDGVATSSQPWVDMGWGYVGAAHAQVAADLILGHATAPPKPAEQAQYMEVYLGAREQTGLLTP